MKKLFLLVFLPFVSLVADEPLHFGEFVIRLLNYGSSWNVTFTATAVTEK